MFTQKAPKLFFQKLIFFTITKTKFYFLAEHANFSLWSQILRKIFFGGKYLDFPFLDIYKCPFFKIRNTFGKKNETSGNFWGEGSKFFYVKLKNGSNEF